ncbi:MAG: glycosyltransferase family 2 protein [Candidatus Marinimicrobia bacterium]|nr:glycosyltransferase family 2 protein [Candidatus Neomarinimicrobiota bacterium]
MISIITLSYDGVEYTRAFVNSIRENTTLPYELIIVDNGSEPATQKWVEDAADKSIIYQNNQGFSRGFNEGVKIAEGEYIMLANNDTEFPPHWDRLLLDTMDKNPGAGIVSPVYTSGRKSALRFQSGDKILKIFPFRKYPSAVAFLMRRSEFLPVFGGYNEDYAIASGEDADLCFTVWKKGYDILIDERVLIIHEGKVTSSSKLKDWKAHFKVNSKQFKRKWFFQFYFPFLAALFRISNPKVNYECNFKPKS